jgi:hypothetical protein
VGRVVIGLGICGRGARIAFGRILLTLFVYEITLEAREFFLFFSFESAK